MAKLSEIRGAFYPPRPNWDVIHRWVVEHVAEPDRWQTWTDLTDQWLDTLNQSLGGHYRVRKTSELILFAPTDFAHGDLLLKCATSGLFRIVRALGSVAKGSWHGPLAILLFENEDTYDSYISAYGRGGEPISSLGLCIRSSNVHIALRPHHVDELQRVLLHELTHACLAHLSLPSWLEEGISQMCEEEARPDWSRFTIDSSEAQELRSFWRRNGLSEFWWGEGFCAADELQAQSYHLAQVLFRNLISQYPKQLPDFLRQAQIDDAGDTAARKCLKISNAEIAEQFLGPGDWEPVPPDHERYSRRGFLYLTQNDFLKSIADFSEALKIKPHDTYARGCRGTAYMQIRKYALAVDDFEEVIRSNPNDADVHNNLAWVLATCPVDSVRNGRRAKIHARKACELTGFASWYCLGTMAAVCAELGDFDSARRWMTESKELAPEEELAGCEKRLQMYWKDEHYRDDPPADL